MRIAFPAFNLSIGLESASKTSHRKANSSGFRHEIHFNCFINEPRRGSIKTYYKLQGTPVASKLCTNRQNSYNIFKLSIFNEYFIAISAVPNFTLYTLILNNVTFALKILAFCVITRPHLYNYSWLAVVIFFKGNGRHL